MTRETREIERQRERRDKGETERERERGRSEGRQRKKVFRMNNVFLACLTGLFPLRPAYPFLCVLSLACRRRLHQAELLSFFCNSTKQQTRSKDSSPPPSSSIFFFFFSFTHFSAASVGAQLQGRAAGGSMHFSIPDTDEIFDDPEARKGQHTVGRCRCFLLLPSSSSSSSSSSSCSCSSSASSVFAVLAARVVRDVMTLLPFGRRGPPWRAMHRVVRGGAVCCWSLGRE